MFSFSSRLISDAIITIFRALVLSADVKPENNFYARLYTDVSSLEALKILGVLVFYRVANLPIKKVCMFKRLVVALKINPQKYNWPQKICKLLKKKFLGSNWSVILMRIKQSEVYDKVLVNEFCVFFTRRRTVTDF